MKKKIFIDNDGGADDFVAIQYAFLSKKFDVKGISLVPGNTKVENVKQNVFKALEMSNVSPEDAKKVGIFIPEKVKEDIESDGAFGDNGLGGVRYKKAVGYEADPSIKAEKRMVDIVNENPGEISIIAIGPLTNIATAIDKDPSFVKNVKEIVIMGGDEGGGNIRPYAEFNVFQDPEAAKKVFEAGFKKITMIGFNVSKYVTLCPEVERFLKQNGEYGDFIYRITRDTAKLDRWKNKVDGASMNDILTLMYLDNENLFKTKKADVEVEVDTETRGRTLVKNGTSIDVVTNADGERILREMLTTLFPGKENEIEEVLDYREGRMASRDYLLQMLPGRREEILKCCNEEYSVDLMDKMRDFIKIAKARAAASGPSASTALTTPVAPASIPTIEETGIER